MKKLIYSKKFPKQDRNPHIQEDFKDIIHRETENELWARMFKDKYEQKVLFADDLHPLREEHIRTCVNFALKNEIDVEVFQGTECVCINLSFNKLVDISELKKSIEFADQVMLVSGISKKAITLSLVYKTHRIVFFNKRYKTKD